MTCIAVGLLLALTLPITTLVLIVFYSERQATRRHGEAYTEDLFYGDDAEPPREFRGLTGRIEK